MRYLLAYAASAIAFLGIDFIWLSLATPRLYRKELAHLLAERPNLPVAAVFYLVYVIGIVVLAAAPAADRGSWPHALGFGALLGLVAYGTYDFTNLSTLRGWPVKLSLIDLGWGTFLSAVAALVAYLVLRAMA